MSAMFRGETLTAADDALHSTGVDSNWNESRYVDFFDTAQSLAGWLRVGQRVNESHAEVSVCLHLPDGSVAFGFSKVPITRACNAVGGVVIQVLQPFELSRVRFEGTLGLLPEARRLLDPKAALQSAGRVAVSLDLMVRGAGLAAVLGADQAEVAAIFLPGQAQAHFQHLVKVEGTAQVEGKSWTVNARGARDQSWGPRVWHAKRWFRWLCAAVDERTGFMLTRSQGYGETRVGGFMWEAGAGHWIDTVELTTDRDDDHLQTATTVTLRSGARQWRARGHSLPALPLRHRQRGADGTEAHLRIVKAPTRWRFDDGREAAGTTEYHDLLEAGRPVGLDY